MFRTQPPHILAAAVLGLCTLVAFPLAAHAVPFTTDLSITGQTDFDEGSATATGGVTQTGTFSVVEGGVSTSSTYSGTTVDTGSDPLLGTLTDIGDGFGITADVDASFGEENVRSLIGLDTEIDLHNMSATDTYKVTFKVNLINHAVEADVQDGFGETEFTVDDETGTEVFFSDLISDVPFGDVKNNVGLGTAGALVSDSGMFSFDVTLAPGAMETITSAYSTRAGLFGLGDVRVDFSSFISVDQVMNLTNPDPGTPAIPEPSTILLFGTGLGALALYRQRGKNNAS